MSSVHVPDVNDPDNIGNDANTQLLELQGAFMEVLTNTGLLGKLKAQLRAAALGVLRGDPTLGLVAVGPHKSFLNVSVEKQISFLLIQDFLAKNYLNHTAGVLEAEVGTSFCTNEAEELLKSRITNVPHESTILEQVVHLAIHSKHVGESDSPESSLATPSHPASEALTSLEQSKSPFKNIEQSKEMSVEMNNGEIHAEIAQYEESIPYSDTEGSVDEEKYAEIQYN